MYSYDGKKNYFKRILKKNDCLRSKTRFNCCLSVVWQLDKGDYPEDLQTVSVLINSVFFF